ncbi:MAG: hypothetical protein SGI89_01135 [bacterium]|nr:hypothetical protein [bacterium]
MAKISIGLLFMIITLFSGVEGYALVNERLVESEKCAEIEKLESIINATYRHAGKRSHSQNRRIFNSYFLQSRKIDLPDSITTYIQTPLFIKFRVLRH